MALGGESGNGSGDPVQRALDALTEEQAAVLAAAATLARMSVRSYARRAVLDRVKRDNAAEAARAGGAAPAPARRRWELPHHSQTPRRARALINEMLAGRLAVEALETFVLLAGELAANAVRHGGPGPVVVQVVLAPDQVLCGVSDGNRRSPIQPAADADAEGGRGLALVGALADTCGWFRIRTGKTVWFGQSSHPPVPPAGPPGDVRRFPHRPGTPPGLLADARDL